MTTYRSIGWLCVALTAACSESQLQSTEDSGTDDGAVNDGAVNDGGVERCEREGSPTDLMVFETLHGEPAALAVPSMGATDVSSTLSGTVTAVGDGFPFFDAPTDMIMPQDPEAFRFIRVQGDDRAWTVLARNVPGFGVRPSAQVSLATFYEFGGWSPARMSVEINTAGKLAFYYAMDGSIDAVTFPAGFSATGGDVLCSASDTCGSWSSYALKVTSPDGATKSLPAESTATLGAFTTWHGQTLHETGGTQCADWFVAFTELAIVRTVPNNIDTFACAPHSTSDLPGVQLTFPNATCQFTLAEAASGVTIPYAITVDAALPGVYSKPLDFGQCNVVEPGKLSPMASIEGNGQKFGIFDTGDCGFPTDTQTGTLSAGTTAGALEWHGLNWYGPSDTGEVEKDPFPPGIYTVKVRAAGVYNPNDEADAGTANDFEVLGTMDILLTE
jgi:hypothetical protein